MTRNIGAVFEFLEMFGYGAAGHGFESRFTRGDWKILSFNPAVNGYLILLKAG